MAKKRWFSRSFLAGLIVLLRFANPCSVAQDSVDDAGELGLTKAYQTAMQRLDDPGKSSLRSVERAWIAFKEKDYSIVASLDKMAGVNQDGYENEENSNQADALTALGKPLKSDENEYYGSSYPKTSADADQSLNSIYRQCLQLLDSDKSQQVKETQASWIAFRDLYCRLDSALRGGHSEDSILRDLTMRRVDQLSHYGRLLSKAKLTAAGIPTDLDDIQIVDDVEGTPEESDVAPTDLFRFAK